MSHDLVIRNGDIVDGSGLPRYRADVAISGGRIAAIGRVRERGREELDATGQVVTPGFIDGHTHMDAQVFWDPLGSCSCWHGVTTVVMGNCGFTLAPASKDKRLLAVRNLERAEDISRAAMDAGIDWTWESFPEYLDVVERLPKGINYAANIGHSTVRTWAMGERAFTETATDADLAKMEGAVREAMRAGAIGFTTSRATAHETADARPVASRIADWKELRHLARAMGEEGGGVLEMAQEPQVGSRDPAERREALARLGALSTDNDITVTVGLMPSGSATEVWKDLLKLIVDTNAAGGRMFAQTHSRGINTILSFRTQLPFDRLAEWSALRALPLEEQAKRLRDPMLRHRLVHEANHAEYGDAARGVEAKKPDWLRLFVYDRPLPPFRTVTEVAAERGVDPVEAMILLALESDMNALFIQPLRVYRDQEMADVMRNPYSVMTFSDSGAHVSQIMDSSIHSHLLSYWVRERREFTLEEAVRMITLTPAHFWGFHDRGLLREGMAADVNVFDASTIVPELPTVVNDLPAGGKRLVSKARGIRATIVGGRIVHREGAHTGALPGKLLRVAR